jgi:hypothetical protein
VFVDLFVERGMWGSETPRKLALNFIVFFKMIQVST